MGISSPSFGIIGLTSPFPISYSFNHLMHVSFSCYSLVTAIGKLGISGSSLTFEMKLITCPTSSSDFSSCSWPSGKCIGIGVWFHYDTKF
ncbi:hypothetical protein BpHYR1_029588 [Brachionus plicatilis]|uniref:Uncharacterized protein n=1 Tax=Brachionus plicatilis TaxID=10195 RepID=A0A3M7SKD3_BRAPC|nr:hypothetical protein BpHYR1_029588 [Brachionus plicatilis]